MNQQFKKAQIFHKAGELKKALNVYKAIGEESRTESVNIYHALCLTQLGRPAEAKAMVDKIEYDKVDTFPALVTLALIYKSLKRLDQSIILLKKIEQKYGESSVVKINLGTIYLSTGKLDEAEEAFLQSEKIEPGRIEVLSNLAQIEIKRSNLDEALNYIRKAEERNPKYLDLYYLRALIFEQQYNIAAAYDEIIEALSRNPSSTSCWTLLARIANEGNWDRPKYQEKLDKVYKKVKDLKVDSPEILSHILTIQKKTLKWVELEYFENLLTQILSSDNTVVPPSSFVAMTLPLDQKSITQSYGSQYSAFRTSEKKNKRENGGKIVFISSDTRNHAVGYLLQSIVSEECFREYACIYTGTPEGTDVYRSIKNGFGNFYEAGAYSQEDRLDLLKTIDAGLLVDLNGFTGAVSLDVISKSPVQVAHWLGMPSSSGSPIFDSMLVDRLIVPETEADSISENAIYLPECVIPSRNIITSTETFADFTFASVQNLFKLNPTLLKTWSLILDKCTSAKFLLRADEEDRDEVAALLVEHNFNMSQIVFCESLGFTENLNRLSKVNCVLDTFPYNGGTSIADTISVGTPAITLYGQAYVSRIGSSIISSAGLSELVAFDHASYIEKAVSLYEGEITKIEIQKRIQSSYFADPSLFSKDLDYTLMSLLSR